mgnify:CR=1 FL=1
MSEEGKVCIGCQEDWPADAEFYREGSPVCLACEAEGVKAPKVKTRGYRTPEAARKHQREKYQRHKEAYKARMRAWHAANRDARNAKRRAAYAAAKGE